MTDRIDDEPIPRAPRVWICVHEHRHGIDAWACTAQDDAFALLASIARRWWEEAREVDGLFPHDEAGPPLPPRPPADDREVVERYFAVMGDADPIESYWLEETEIIDMSRSQDRRREVRR